MEAGVDGAGVDGTGVAGTGVAGIVTVSGESRWSCIACFLPKNSGKITAEMTAAIVANINSSISVKPRDFIVNLNELRGNASATLLV